MKASTILSTAIIWTKRLETLDRNYVAELLEVILLLVKDRNKETYNAIISFLKAFIKNAAKDLVLEKLGMIMQAIFVWDKTSQMVCKGRVKNLLIKLLKRVEMSEIEQFVPEEHSNLLKNLAKQKRRELNKKKNSRTFGDGAEESWLDDELNNEDFKKIKLQSRRKRVEDIEDDMEDIEMANPYAGRSSNYEEKPEHKNLLLKFDQNEETFHFVEHPTLSLQSNRKKMDLSQNDDDSGPGNDDLVYYNEKENRLVIRERAAKLIGFKRRRQQIDDEAVEEEAHGDEKVSRKKIKEEKGQTLAARLLEKHKKKDYENVHTIREVGDTYKAKDGKTKGDVTIPGKAAPHAFIQFNPIALQKKHMGKASGAFDKIVNKKKNGALKGLSSKKK